MRAGVELLAFHDGRGGDKHPIVKRCSALADAAAAEGVGGAFAEAGAVFDGRLAGELTEPGGERAQARVADHQADLGDREVGRAQQVLRALDATGADRIMVEAVPAGDEWAAVADRLARASAAGSADEGLSGP